LCEPDIPVGEAEAGREISWLLRHPAISGGLNGRRMEFAGVQRRKTLKQASFDGLSLKSRRDGGATVLSAQ
jgi:hypothetical protein